MTWLPIVLGAIAGAMTGAGVSYLLSARVAEHSRYGAARAEARLVACGAIRNLRNEFAQRAAIARRGNGWPALAEFNPTSFEISLAREVAAVRARLTRRDGSQAEAIVARLVSTPARAVAEQFPLGEAFDADQARAVEAISAQLSMTDSASQVAVPTLPPPPGPLLLRSWHAPLVGPNHDDVIEQLDNLLEIIDPVRTPRRRGGSRSS